MVCREESKTLFQTGQKKDQTACGHCKHHTEQSLACAHVGMLYTYRCHFGERNTISKPFQIIQISYFKLMNASMTEVIITSPCALNVDHSPLFQPHNREILTLSLTNIWVWSLVIRLLQVMRTRTTSWMRGFTLPRTMSRYPSVYQGEMGL